MKRIMLSLLCGVALFIGGCASISYLGSDGSQIKYNRFGPQAMKDLHLELSDGSKLDLGEQKSDPVELIKLGMQLGTGVVPTP